MRASLSTGLLSLACLVPSGCREDPPIERHYPMRAPTHVDAPSAVDSSAPVTAATDTASAGEPTKLRERPKADPAIDATLERINHCGLRFIDQPDSPDDRPTEYTAEQFASMLRSKWDWIGYDIVDHDVWLVEIATRSFKSNLPYLVVLQDGTSMELRAWLDTAPPPP